MSVVRHVPFPDPSGVIRDLVVTAPPEPLVLLPEPDASRAEFVAAAKATHTFLFRFLSFRLFVSSLRSTARLYADDGSMATAVSNGGQADLGIFASVFVTPAEGEAATFEEEDEVMRFAYAHGRPLAHLQVHVKVAAAQTVRDHDPLELASAWLASLEPVQRFDRESNAQPR